MLKQLFLLNIGLMLLLASACSSASATTPTAISNPAQISPLVKILAFAPDNQAVRDNEISYVDYHALVAARPGAVWPKSPDDWKTLNSAGGKDLGLFNVTMGGVNIVAPQPQSAELSQIYFSGGGDMLDLTGINVFSIDRGLYFGQPPGTMAVYAGNFDADAVAQAFQKRSYTKNDLNGLTMWCGPIGCDKGTTTDPKAADPRDPFGGGLGRQQPVVITSDYVFSSPSLEVLTSSATSYQNTSGLAKAPDYLALAESVTQSGTLLQATFISAKLVSSSYSTGIQRLPPTVLDQLRKTMEDNNSSVPAYTLAGVAHTIDGDSIITYIALVYDKEDDAKTAALAFPNQFTQSPSVVSRGKTFGDLLKDRNATLDAVKIYTSQATGKFVVLLPIRSPIESAELETGQTIKSPNISGLIYRIFANALISHDLLWLATKDMIQPTSNP